MIVDMKGFARNSIAKTSKAYAKYWQLMMMLLPGVVFFLIFKYIPIYGLQIAFKDFYLLRGIWGSPWAGLKYFELFAITPSFALVVRNTLVISFYQLIFGFPSSILLALILNELSRLRFKKIVQTVSYLPHFVSWVVLAGIFFQFLSPSIGPINIILKRLGFEPIFFLGSNTWFVPTLIVTEIWKGIGWGSIVYLAALAGIDPGLYEAAIIDGAGRLQRIWHITLPSLTPVITVMLIFAVGRIINDNFDQIFNLYSPVVYPTGDVVSTYVYRVGLRNMQFSFATAVGLSKNVISFVLIIGANAIAKRINEYGIW